MFREFRRTALGPIIIGAAIAALIASVGTFGEPYRSILAGAAGAIGGSISAALLQARKTAEDHRRACVVLAVTLRELAPVWGCE